MKYKTCFSEFLVISSIFYYITAMLDFSITMCGYAHYGDLFYQMELNPSICFLLKSGFPPIHMFIIPFTLICLTYYLHKKTNKVIFIYQSTEIINKKITWGILFGILLLFQMGMIHLLGFLSWFYYGAF